jgi:hypothetical protein
MYSSLPCYKVLVQDCVSPGVHVLPACDRQSTPLPAELLITNAPSFWKPGCSLPVVQVRSSNAHMPVARITVQGLTSIAILVALLWTCVIGERVILGRANADAVEVIEAMRDLRSRTRREPAAAHARPGRVGHRVG